MSEPPDKKNPPTYEVIDLQQTKQSLQERTENFLTQKDFVETFTNHVAEGGSLGS